MSDRSSPISSADTLANSRDVLPRKRARQNGKTNSTLGCLPCRRRKKRCDDAKPSCNNCRTQGLECKWPQKGTRKKNASCWADTELEQASQRIKSLPISAGSSGCDPIVFAEDQQPTPTTTQPAELQPQGQDISTQSDAASGHVRANMTSAHHDEGHPLRAASEPHAPQTEQPPDHFSSARVTKELQENPPIRPASTMHVGRNERPMGQVPGSYQTELQRVNQQGQPNSVSKEATQHSFQAEPEARPGPVYRFQEMPGPDTREIVQDCRNEQHARERVQHRNSSNALQTFEIRSAIARQVQPKHHPPLREPQLQIQTQAFYPSQYDSLARNSQLQGLPQSLPRPPTSHPAQLSHATNKTRMIKGQMYEHSDPELVYDRTRCHFLLSRFNSSGSSSAEERRRLAKGFLKSIGEGVEIEVPFRCEYGYNIKIGDGTYIGRDCLIEDPSIVSIGSKCVIGSRVSICSKKSSPNVNDHDGSRSLFYGPGVWIEDRVCIETGVIIHAGVRIGTGSTIVAGSVVTKSIRERSLAGGNPATVFQYI